MRNINLLPEDKKENNNDNPDSQLDAKEVEALSIVHKIRSMRHLLKLAEKEGVDINSAVKQLCEQLDQGNEIESRFQVLENIIGRVIADITKILAEAGVNIPPGVQHELGNNRFMAFRGTVD